MPSVYSKKTAGVADRSGRPSVPPAVRSRKSNRYITLPPLAPHSSDVLDSVQPWPLQAFWPLHELVADLQALWPLQALVPPHFTPSAKAAVAKVLAANTEAAAMMRLRLSMEILPIVLRLNVRTSCPLQVVRRPNGERYGRRDKFSRNRRVAALPAGL